MLPLEPEYRLHARPPEPHSPYTWSQRYDKRLYLTQIRIELGTKGILDALDNPPPGFDTQIIPRVKESLVSAWQKLTSLFVNGGFITSRGELLGLPASTTPELAEQLNQLDVAYYSRLSSARLLAGDPYFDLFDASTMFIFIPTGFYTTIESEAEGKRSFISCKQNNTSKVLYPGGPLFKSMDRLIAGEYDAHNVPHMVGSAAASKTLFHDISRLNVSITTPRDGTLI